MVADVWVSWHWSRPAIPLPYRAGTNVSCCSNLHFKYNFQLARSNFAKGKTSSSTHAGEQSMGSKKQFHLLEELDHDPAASEFTEQTGPIPYWDVNRNICLVNKPDAACLDCNAKTKTICYSIVLILTTSLLKGQKKKQQEDTNTQNLRSNPTMGTAVCYI